MATAIAAPMPAWPASQQTAGMGWSDPHMQYHHPPPMSTSNFYMAQSMRPPPAMRAPMTPHEPLPKPGQSSPWTTEEDNLLVEAKSQGLAWEEIHKRHFPNKSGNACRKRHERVMAKLRETDWDEARIRRVISQYNRPGVRESIWRPLSDLVGEKWEDVEKVCYQQGLKGLKVTRAPRHHRARSLASSAQGALSEYDHGSSNDEYENNDDSGIALSVSAHSRRASELGSLPVTTAPSLDHILQQTTTGPYGYPS